MKNLLKLYPILLLLLLTSCLKEVPAPGSDEPPQPIINFIMRPGEYPKATVRASNLNFNSPQADKYYKAIREGEINLFKNGSYLSSLRYDSISNYTYLDSNIVIETNADYHFTYHLPEVNFSASSPNVTVPTGVIPTQIVFTNTPSQKWIELTLPKSTANQYVLLHFTAFSDEDTVYQRFSLSPYVTEGDWLGISQPNQSDYNYSNVGLYTYWEDVAIEVENGYSLTDVVAFAVNTMEATGSEAKIKIKFSTNDYGTFTPNQKLLVQTVSVNKDYYDYIISAKKYQQTANNPFSTPVQVYSNIIGGMGIFGAATITQVIVE